MKKIKLFLNDPFLLFVKFFYGKMKMLSSEKYLRIIYYLIFKQKLNLKNPETYNEKLQWLKLNDKNAEYIKMVDKYEVREVVQKKISDNILIPIYGVWDRFEDIDFDSLPNEFVIKCTHDSGSVIVCKDKTKLDLKKTSKKIQDWQKRNHFWKSREWAYKSVKPRIIIEKYMVDKESKVLKDYKFFCFNGKVEFLFVASNRELGKSNIKFDYFDKDFNKINVRQSSYPNSVKEVRKPINFKEMINICEKLSESIPHVRIDLYEVDNKIYFGEYTFFHHGGMVPFEPKEFDKKFGSLIDLDLVSFNK